MLTSTVRITRTGEDQYHFVNQDRNIDEEVDGSKLLGLLKRDTLLSDRDEVIGGDELVLHLDNKPIGTEMVLRMREFL
jgi:hypothetical protein